MFSRSRKSFIMLATVACGLAGLWLYQTAQSQTAPQAAAPAATYQVDTNASRAYVRVNSAGRFGHIHGIEGRLAASTVTLGGEGSLVFDMTTFTADTPQARQYVGLDAKFSQSDAQKVTANMRGPDVLNVSQFPQATFKFASLTPQDGQAAGQPGKYQAKGSFTLHGQTQDVEFPATVEKTDQEGVLHMTGSFSIQQTSYGITPYSALGGLARVADQLQIWGDLTLTPAK